MKVKTFIRLGRYVEIGTVSILIVIIIVVACLYLANILFPRHFHFWQGTRQDPARRAACAGNVKYIGEAMIQYAKNHDMRYPESAGVLLKEGHVSVGGFFCPSSGDRRRCPKDLLERLLDGDVQSEELGVLNQVEELGSYVLVKGKKHVGKGEIIIVYDKARNHANDWIELDVGRNCCFDNGDTKWLTEEEFQKRIKEQQDSRVLSTTLLNATIGAIECIRCPALHGNS